MTWDLTNGGEGRRYAGSSSERGRDVVMSITVEGSWIKRDIVMASRGLSYSQGTTLTKMITGAHFAGQPNEKFVLDIRVVGSNISSKWASSTAGSHSCLSSGVDKTAFQGSKDTKSSPVGTSKTSL